VVLGLGLFCAKELWFFDVFAPNWSGAGLGWADLGERIGTGGCAAGSVQRIADWIWIGFVLLIRVGGLGLIGFVLGLFFWVPGRPESR